MQTDRKTQLLMGLDSLERLNEDQFMEFCRYLRESLDWDNEDIYDAQIKTWPLVEEYLKYELR